MERCKYSSATNMAANNHQNYYRVSCLASGGPPLAKHDNSFDGCFNILAAIFLLKILQTCVSILQIGGI